MDSKNTFSSEIVAKVLAVDDRKENLVALEASLPTAGLELVCVQSGALAIEEVKKNEFAVILLDVQMPIMNGFETARRIRALPEGKNVPIIFVTAIHRDESYVGQGYIEGAVDYLFKPINVDVLQAKVSVFCDIYRKNKEIQEQIEAISLSRLREQQNQLLKKAISARDEFISIASHELKTPLTPLGLNLQVISDLCIEDRLETIPKDKLQRMLAIANHQVVRLSRLVGELLDVSRIVEGKFTLSKGEVSLSKMVRGVLDNFHTEIEKTGSSVQAEIDEDVRGCWDGPRLEQVVVNLLSNALKYGEGKSIFVEVKATEKHATFSIRDNGIGIAREDHERIFDRFERANSKRNFGGLGLGLYISKNILDLHGGTISVQSEPQQGATFRFSLPVA